MRKLLISAAAIALFTLPLSLSAAAQPDHDRGHEGGGQAPQAPHGGPLGGGHPEHGGGAPHPQPGPNAAPNRGGNSGRPAMTSNPGYSRGPTGGGFNHPAPAANPAYTRGPTGGGNFHAQNTPHMAGRPGPGNRPGGNGGGRHDFHGFVDFHQNFDAQRHFHAGAYRRPQGWYSHHWVFGETLPALFWARDYWLTDYVDFGLPPPPYGAVWVRNGNDALLIDQDTGEIITVEYGVFY
ncbi:MAG TPA: RcnB family protein [Rhizomicrobium sp.]|nr:RcnB family protein [Rhizomicrobium sp.]